MQCPSAIMTSLKRPFNALMAVLIEPISWVGGEVGKGVGGEVGKGVGVWISCLITIFMTHINTIQTYKHTDKLTAGLVFSITYIAIDTRRQCKFLLQCQAAPVTSCDRLIIYKVVLFYPYWDFKKYCV